MWNLVCSGGFHVDGVVLGLVPLLDVAIMSAHACFCLWGSSRVGFYWLLFLSVGGVVLVFFVPSPLPC